MGDPQPEYTSAIDQSGSLFQEQHASELSAAVLLHLWFVPFPCRLRLECGMCQPGQTPMHLDEALVHGDTV